MLLKARFSFFFLYSEFYCYFNAIKTGKIKVLRKNEKWERFDHSSMYRKAARSNNPANKYMLKFNYKR